MGEDECLELVLDASLEPRPRSCSLKLDPLAQVGEKTPPQSRPFAGVADLQCFGCFWRVPGCTFRQLATQVAWKML